MRSGQYKLAGAGSGEVSGEVTLGQFRSSACDLAGGGGPGSEFPHMNSLVVGRGRLGEPRHNKSCDNLTTRVRSLLSRPRPAPPQDAWQYGHVVTLPRRPRPSVALPQAGCDTASCLSASSGYSSSASSNYGSFKSSSSSSCSTLPRPTLPSPRPVRPATLVDNPMYDVRPGAGAGAGVDTHIYDTTPDGDPEDDSQEPLYDTIPASRLLTPDSGTHGGPDSLDSLDPPDSLEPPDPPEDQVARQCREYFEQRLKNSENLKKRWSMCSSDSGADSGDSDAPPHPVSAPPQSHYNTSSTSSTSTTTTTTTTTSTSSNKTPLDHKMDFLRKEIASLMKQDNALFRQLLTLHQSISALKTAPRSHATLRPASPASLDSFTEEEEEEEEDDEDEEEDEEENEGQVNESQVSVSGGVVVGGVKPGEGRRKVVDEGGLSEVDEGLDTDDHCSTSHSASPTSTLSSNSSYNSTFSRTSSSKASPSDSSPHQPFQRDTSSPQPLPPLTSHNHCSTLIRSRKSYAPTARNRRRSSSAHLLIRPELSCPERMSYLETDSSSIDTNGHREADLSTLGRNQHKKAGLSISSRDCQKPESNLREGRWGEGGGWTEDNKPTPRPRSSSAVVPPIHHQNYHSYHLPTTTTTTTTSTTASRPLPRTPYREALIM